MRNFYVAKFFVSCFQLSDSWKTLGGRGNRLSFSSVFFRNKAETEIDVLLLFNSQHCHLLPWGNKQSVGTFVLDEKTKGWWIGSPQIKEGAQKWLAQDEVLAKEIEWWVKAPRPLIKLVYSQQLVFCSWLLESHYPSWFKRKPRTLHLFIQTMCNYKQNCTKLFLWSPGIHVLPLYISQKWMCSLFFIALWDLATDLLVVWLNLYFQPANGRKFKTSSSFYC